MLRKDPFITGEYYHIYNRGIDKRVIFKSVHDHKRFMMLLYVSNNIDVLKLDTLINILHKKYDEILKIKRDKPLISIGAWCLMGNHFHLLVRQEVDGGITKFMRKIGTGYSMYFNKKYQRQGALFGGPFKSKLIGVDDNYMRHLFGYIHLNPLDIKFSDWKENMKAYDKKEMQNFLDEYEYSSYTDHTGEDRLESALINKNNFPEYFASRQDFKDFVENYFANVPTC